MKTFTKQEIRDLLNKVIMDEISFPRMVEIMNERVSERVEEMNEPQYIPFRKFKSGDKVRIKEGISSKTHNNIDPVFVREMDDLIGKTMTINRYTYGDYYVKCEGIEYDFLEDWLEPYEELEKGDLAIFWDDEKEYAVVKIYERFDALYKDFQHKDHMESGWKNAIKFESKEQFERLIRGEI